jgi:hypothetical protein
MFSDAASYRLRLRPVTIPAGGPGSRFDVRTDEYDITCTFAAPVTIDAAGNPVQAGTCALPNGDTVSFRVNDALRQTARARPLVRRSGGYPH